MVSPEVSVPATLLRRVKKQSIFGTTSGHAEKREALKESFRKLRLSVADDERKAWTPRVNTRASEDYTNVFLSHARLYVFAEKWYIQSLKRLALKNLHETLWSFNLWSPCIGDVVALLRFAYQNTSRPPNGDESMRTMLNQYVTYEMEKIVEAASFRTLLEEIKDFLDDFCSAVKRRI